MYLQSLGAYMKNLKALFALLAITSLAYGQKELPGDNAPAASKTEGCKRTT